MCSFTRLDTTKRDFNPDTKAVIFKDSKTDTTINLSGLFLKLCTKTDLTILLDTEIPMFYSFCFYYSTRF